MDKELVYNNIQKMINDGVFLKKYCKLTEGVPYEEENIKFLEETSANVFNSILIGCQLFDDEERIKAFVDMFSIYLDPSSLEYSLPEFDISKEEALERLKHGFGVHFTTKNICDEIKKSGSLSGYGKNAMFTEEENMIIDAAAKEQIEKDPSSKETLNYLFKGWGTGVSSYSSMTNGFWMYHTPESLSFLYGDISKRDKNVSMEHINKCVSALSDENKTKAIDTMSNIYDRLIGDEQEVGCILIDRDSFEYEVDYYYNTNPPTKVERRPYSNSFNDLMNNDSKITNDITVDKLKFVSVPTVKKLEQMKIDLSNSFSQGL